MRYVFSECVVDTQLYTLHRPGKAVRLRPKVFHVLHYLLDHRDHVVSKEELYAHVWPGQYDQAIAQLRTTPEMNGQFPLAHLWLGRAYQEKRYMRKPSRNFKRRARYCAIGR